MRSFAVFVIALFCCHAAAQAGAPVRVLSFNIFVGGEGLKRPLEEVAAVVRAAEADVVGVQEAHGAAANGVEPDNGKKIAALLGWNYLPQSDKRGILTRLEIVRPSTGRNGALLRTPDGREFWFFNVHFPAAPYQPYMLAGIDYGGEKVRISTAEEAIRSARIARGKQVDALLADIQGETGEAAGPGSTPGAAVVVVTGDFNEPSHLDWTADAVKAGRCPIVVDWPATRALTDAGFIDAYRHRHPDPVSDPAHTWTPLTAPTDRNDRHDRIDFVMVRGLARDGVEKAVIVGEKPEAAEEVFKPWPSDHRAVLAVIRLPETR